MKLVQALEFATDHDNFKKFVKRLDLEVDEAYSVRISDVNKSGGCIHYEIHIDYGKQGRSSKDVWMKIRYNLKEGGFIFDEVINQGS